MKEIRVVVYTEKQEVTLEYLKTLVTLYLTKMVQDTRDKGVTGIYYDIQEIQDSKIKGSTQMATIKLIAKHGDFTIEVESEKIDELITLYQELLMKLEVLKREG